MAVFYAGPRQPPQDATLEPLTREEVPATAEAAAVAELAYRDGEAHPRLCPVTPLLMDGEPAFTLTYADLELAGELSRSPRVCLVFSDSRLAYAGWKPLAVTATAEVVPDPEGETFVGKQLLWQELRKFPPARALADTPLLRREYWWYVPRLVVRLGGLGEPAPVGRRTGEENGVLAWSGDEGLAAETVRVGDWETSRIPVTPLSPGGGGLPDGSPAALFSHDFEVPEMEQRAAFLVTGRLSSGRLEVEDRSGRRELGRRPGLLGRWRALKGFEKACKAGLASRG